MAKKSASPKAAPKTAASDVPAAPAPKLVIADPLKALPDPSEPKEQSEKVKSRIRSFTAKLPLSVKDSIELDWVYCHPRMVERAESTGNLAPIQINLRDIKTPGHGPAPSQRAIILLRHWIQNPRKFFEGQLDAQKKRASLEKPDDGPNQDELDFLDDLKDVDRMIREATKTTRVKSEKKLAAKT